MLYKGQEVEGAIVELRTGSYQLVHAAAAGKDGFFELPDEHANKVQTLVVMYPNGVKDEASCFKYGEYDLGITINDLSEPGKNQVRNMHLWATHEASPSGSVITNEEYERMFNILMNPEESNIPGLPHRYDQR